MDKLPRLKIRKYFGGGPQEEKVCEFEQARELLANYWPSDQWAGVLVAVDGQLIHSHEELRRLASKEPYRDKEFIQVGIYPQAGGG